MNPSEKYEFVSWDDDIPNCMESHKNHVPNHQPDEVSKRFSRCSTVIQMQESSGKPKGLYHLFLAIWRFPRGTIPQIIQHQTIPVSKPMVLSNVGDGLWLRASGAQASLAVSGSQQMTYISQRPTAEVGQCWYDPIHLAELSWIRMDGILCFIVMMLCGCTYRGILRDGYLYFRFPSFDVATWNCYNLCGCLGFHMIPLIVSIAILRCISPLDS